MRFFFEFVICVIEMHLTQHPIDAMLQFDANANATVDASVNGP